MSEQSEYLRELWHNSVTHEAYRERFYPAFPVPLDAEGFETMTFFRSEVALESSRRYLRQEIVNSEDLQLGIQQSFNASDKEMVRFRRNEGYVSLDHRSRLYGRNKNLIWVYPTASHETNKRRMKLVSVGEVKEADIDVAAEGEALGIFPQALLNRIASGEPIYILPWALITSYDFTCTSWGNYTSPLTGTIHHASVGWIQGDHRDYWEEPQLRPIMSVTTNRVWSEATSSYLDITTELDYFYRIKAIASQGWNMANPLGGSAFSSNE